MEINRTPYKTTMLYIYIHGSHFSFHVKRGEGQLYQNHRRLMALFSNRDRLTPEVQHPQSMSQGPPELPTLWDQGSLGSYRIMHLKDTSSNAMGNFWDPIC